MLSIKTLSQARIALIKRSSIVTLFRSQYHSFHEDNASVLPNLVETASASFKVTPKKKTKRNLPLIVYFFYKQRKIKRTCKN